MDPRREVTILTSPLPAAKAVGMGQSGGSVVSSGRSGTSSVFSRSLARAAGAAAAIPSFPVQAATFYRYIIDNCYLSGLAAELPKLRLLLSDPELQALITPDELSAITGYLASERLHEIPVTALDQYKRTMLLYVVKKIAQLPDVQTLLQPLATLINAEMIARGMTTISRETVSDQLASDSLYQESFNAIYDKWVMQINLSFVDHFVPHEALIKAELARVVVDQVVAISSSAGSGVAVVPLSIREVNQIIKSRFPLYLFSEDAIYTAYRPGESGNILLGPAKEGYSSLTDLRRENAKFNEVQLWRGELSEDALYPTEAAYRAYVRSVFKEQFFPAGIEDATLDREFEFFLRHCYQGLLALPQFIFASNQGPVGRFNERSMRITKVDKYQITARTRLSWFLDTQGKDLGDCMQNPIHWLPLNVTMTTVLQEKTESSGNRVFAVHSITLTGEDAEAVHALYKYSLEHRSRYPAKRYFALHHYAQVCFIHALNQRSELLRAMTQFYHQDPVGMYRAGRSEQDQIIIQHLVKKLNLAYFLVRDFQLMKQRIDYTRISHYCGNYVREVLESHFADDAPITLSHAIELLNKGMALVKDLANVASESAGVDATGVVDSVVSTSVVDATLVSDAPGAAEPVAKAVEVAPAPNPFLVVLNVLKLNWIDSSLGMSSSGITPDDEKRAFIREVVLAKLRTRTTRIEVGEEFKAICQAMRACFDPAACERFASLLESMYAMGESSTQRESMEKRLYFLFMPAKGAPDSSSRGWFGFLSSPKPAPDVFTDYLKVGLTILRERPKPSATPLMARLNLMSPGGPVTAATGHIPPQKY
jgi:hypothetical protein